MSPVPFSKCDVIGMAGHDDDPIHEEILKQFSFLSFVLSTEGGQTQERPIEINDGQTQEHAIILEEILDDDLTGQTQEHAIILEEILDDHIPQEHGENQTGHVQLEHGDNVTSHIHPNEDNDDDDNIGKVHSFGDYGTYFRHKHIKQQKSDKEYREWDKLRNNGIERPQIFNKMVFHVNGYTNPSINELHRLMIIHGGLFLSYLTKKSAATHVICDRLTPRKLVEFKHCKVVRAQWIVDCIQEGKLLDWKAYRTIPDIDYAQKRLSFGCTMAQSDSMADSKSEPESKSESKLSNSNSNLDVDFSKSDDIESDPEILPLTQSQKVIEEQYGEPPRILDAKHPDFLKSFFAKSRLHHLSTWKADLRLKFLRRIVQQQKCHLQNTNTLFTKVILHIDFDCFFATASAQNYPNIDFQTTPIAVSHGVNTSDIASCNYVARSFGIKNGMWVGGARKLCPNLVCLGYDFQKYEEYASHFYNYLLLRDDLDTIFPVLIDEVLVDCTLTVNKNNTNGSGVGVAKEVDVLMSTIRRDIFDLTKCTISIGASHNVLLAKLALRKSKPNGQYYLSSNIEGFLEDVLVRSLPGVGRSIEKRIAQEIDVEEPLIQHIRTLFNEQKLCAMLGKATGKKIWNYAYGIDDTAIEFDENNKEAILGRKTVSLDVNYGIRFDKVDQVDKFLMQLSQELYSRLISLRFCGSQLTLKLAIRLPEAPIDPPKYLGMGRCYFVSKSSRLGVATNDWGIIGSELKSLFRIASVQIKDLRGIAVTMSKLEDAELMKRSRQKTLDLNDLIVAGSKRRKRTVTGSSDYSVDKIDWDVFKSLPKSLQLELELEQIKGGSVGTRTSSTKSSGVIPSPTKPNGVKAYLQQLIPYQQGVLPEYVRVVEKSPTKKAIRKQLPKKRSASNPPSSPPNWQDESYNTSVLQELPSSLRAEVVRDQQISRKFKHESLKQKLLDKQNILRDVETITQAWIDSKATTVNRSPLFLNEKVTTLSMKKKIQKWIQETVEEGGPHPDDVQVFAAYIKQLLTMGDLTRSMVLVQEMENRIDYEFALLNRDRNRQVGVEVWKEVKEDINTLISQYCRCNKIII
ncbi:deoxycytidyl transferase [Scheffersomyces spartinae]|uniref:DNA repair protein REV1 n=1 Tax=Scheffersomyces spartinae TaxID=45513 RepID=A0A9P7V915_9ASCO|nr:deoxycytidyl transferase [Scheffersomyces spartinae]KAG7193521.1 deoxycytidyl transferase [Scheffersomyces spartinae]